MGSFGGYYKGEKKKQKKEKSSRSSTGLSVPTFNLPQIIPKKKRA